MSVLKEQTYFHRMIHVYGKIEKYGIIMFVENISSDASKKRL